MSSRQTFSRRDFLGKTLLTGASVAIAGRLSWPELGDARWSGPRLKDVLERAGVKSTGKFVAFFGLDEPPGKVPKFVRGIPMDKAMDPDTLLAMQMNGAPLTKHHGYPVRALTPGWIG